MQDDEEEERRQAELDFVEAAYDPEEAWCVRGDRISQIFYRINPFDWVMCISLPRGYPKRELVEIHLDDASGYTTEDGSLRYRLLDVCRQAAAALPGEEAVFAVLNAAEQWTQQQLGEEEETDSSSSVALQKIAVHQLSSLQAWTKTSKEWDFYRLVKKPHALTALVAQMPPGAHVSGTDDRSWFLKGNTNYEPERRTCLQALFPSKLIFRLVWLDETTRQQQQQHRQEENLELWGTCQEAVAETAAWLFSLPDQQRHILSMLKYGNSMFPFECLFSELLPALLSPNRFRQVRFGGIDFSEEHSAILATQEHEVNIAMAHCWLAGGGVTFLNCLQQRKTPFGSLTLDSVHPFSDDAFASLLVNVPLSGLRLLNVVLRDAWLPFRARARHVELVNCTVEDDDNIEDDAPLTVRPKAFVLGFDPVRNSVHYNRFLDASHGLNKLGIQFHGRPTAEQMQHLLCAIENHHEWKVLELGQDIVCLKDYWNELMTVLRKSQTIGKLRLHTRNSSPDAEMLIPLKQLLEDRRHMQVIFPTDDWPLTPTVASEWEIELSRSLAFNRWYLGVVKLQSVESLLRRDALFGRALLQQADFCFVSFLLASNMDVLLSFMENQ